MRTLTITTILALAACGTPPGKDGANSSTQNAATNNNTGLNVGLNVVANNAANSSTRPSIDPSQYDQTCSFDTGCSVVTTDVCCPGCAGAAVTTSELERYLADLQDRGIDCKPEDQLCSAAPCQEFRPVCLDGSCDIRTPLYLDAQEWDTSCEVDTDCMMIPAGDVCDLGCFCNVSQGIAIAASEADRVSELVASVQCSPEPGCNCPSVPQAFCDAGVCAPLDS